MAEKMRLLIKVRAGQGAAPLFPAHENSGLGRISEETFQLGKNQEKARITFSAAPLFRSVGRGPALGAAADGAEWQMLTAQQQPRNANPWQACHDLVSAADARGTPIAFAEPDLEQQWPIARQDMQGLSLAGHCDAANAQNPDYPLDAANPLWFRDAAHGQYDAAQSALSGAGPGAGVRIAHFDTGYDPRHKSKPEFLNLKLQRSFVDGDKTDDASDDTSGLFNNLGHGAGTLSILAGAAIGGGGKPVGIAPFAEVVPVRVANRVVLFRNSAIAQAFDYVLGLCASPATRVQVITMSMGGVASQAWAEAVNALYEAGVFIVTAAGNNYFNVPTHDIVYPARFNRVVAACGVMQDGRPYADLSPLLMAGNYGPAEKMATAIAAYTPNTPWARLGCPGIVDANGNGTSAATPQVAAAAALWIQKHRAAYDAYSAPWMRVEAVRKALFDSARFDAALESHLGKGRIAANDALAAAPAPERALRMQKPDSAGFSFLKLLTGLGVEAKPVARAAMLELEARQMLQQTGFAEGLLEAAARAPQDPRAAARLAEAFLAKPGLSRELREALEGGAASGAAPGAALPGEGAAKAPPIGARPPDQHAIHSLHLARNPKMPKPSKRMLRIFAFDPAASVDLDTFGVNAATVGVRWEDLSLGPVGEYIEVVDVDPASGCCYAPVDLNHPYLIAQNGLAPSEGQPQFHQQMVYAVAMRTIEHFERALGRSALWSSRYVRDENGNVQREDYVRRLRIYPHALRAANAYYSSDRKALLMGYFRARDIDAGASLPGGRIFTALSHDIVAHETAHALLDGLHRRYQEPTNPDMLAFHEAFADIIAIFQHFTIPEALLDQVRRARGDLEDESLLGQLAVQFGQATRGGYAALRNAIGFKNEMGVWERARPKRTDYPASDEPHARGAVLVSAVFAAFAKLYRMRIADLIRLGTGGTGVLPEGDIPHDLAQRLAQEASKLASHILGVCIRALDYCPPVDLTFGDYLRAMITADRDLVPDDPRGYRVAFIAAFRERGIYPSGVQALSVESAVWEGPPVEMPEQGLPEFLKSVDLNWTTDTDREAAYRRSKDNAKLFWHWLHDVAPATIFPALGFKRIEADKSKAGQDKARSAGQKEIVEYEDADGRPARIEGELRPIEVHSMRPARRIGPDGQSRASLIIEITQTLRVGAEEKRYRAGCTLIIDMQSVRPAYFIRKRMRTVIEREMKFLGANSEIRTLRSTYFGPNEARREPFAALHGAH